MMRPASREEENAMAAKRKSAAKGRTSAKAKPSGDAMIISKARVKVAVRKCNVGTEFYGALEGAVRDLISRAEDRALANKRKTLRGADV
jgi:histone H3/H4